MRVLIFATLLLIAACGQKGQLYLPGPAQTDISEPGDEATETLQPEAVGKVDGETDELEVKKDNND